jgi:hypothetical protein
MATINVTSDGQRGGITAGVVNVGMPPGGRKRKKAKMITIVVAIIGVLAGLATVAEYLDWKPWKKASMSDDEKKSIYNVTSKNQSGGITAGQVTVGHPPRQMDEVNRRGLRDHIPAGAKVDVTAVLGDGEALRLAQQIAQFLLAEGYSTSGGASQAIYTQAVTGVSVQPNSDGSWSVVVGSRE